MYPDIPAVAPRASWGSFFPRPILSAVKNQFFHVFLSPGFSSPGFSVTSESHDLKWSYKPASYLGLVSLPDAVTSVFAVTGFNPLDVTVIDCGPSVLKVTLDFATPLSAALKV